jgi:hypothetical protein
VAKENSKLGKDLERLNRQIQGHKKSLHDVEIKAEELYATIQTAGQAHESLQKKRKQ